MSVFITRRGATTTGGTTPEPIIKADPVLANNTWAEIIEACQTNAIPSSWAVGDRKSMHINGTDYVFHIIGFNHDTYSDGTGIAPVTFQLVDAHNVGYQMEDSNTNSVGWTNSDMRKSHLPLILSTLPSEVQAGIREVNKLTSRGAMDATIATTADKLFLLSEEEVFSVHNFSYAGEGIRYEFYKNAGSRVKVMVGSGTQGSWWLRSPMTNTTGYAVVSGYGEAGYSGNTTDSLAVSYAFCF